MPGNSKFVPASELYVTDNINAAIETVTASCIALTLYDPLHHIAGLLHVVLPGRRGQKKRNPPATYFADMGVPLLIKKMIAFGAEKNNLVATIAGGAATISDAQGIQIGQKNADQVKSLLEKSRIPIIREEVGGNRIRRILMRVSTGGIHIENMDFKPQLQELPMELDDSIETIDSLQIQLENLQTNPTYSRKLLELMHADPNSIKWGEAEHLLRWRLPENIINAIAPTNSISRESDPDLSLAPYVEAGCVLAGLIGAFTTLEPNKIKIPDEILKKVRINKDIHEIIADILNLLHHEGMTDYLNLNL